MLDAFQRAARKHSQRAQKYGVLDTLTADEIQQRYDMQNGRCHWCECVVTGHGMSCMVVDHLTAMSQGGTNTADNTVIACLRCNLSKNKRDADTFMRQTGRSPAPTYDQRIIAAIQAGNGYAVDEKFIAKHLGQKMLNVADTNKLRQMKEEGLLEMYISSDTRAPSGIKLLYRVK